ncbi:MAG: hypothetical protein IT198_15490 [Acidimicrobiia bacterium]|nr:hypothetical protein [Acidimicrobiia bacterium]
MRHVGAVRFLYVGTDDIEADLEQMCERWGGSRRWRFRHFGTEVAAVDMGAGPLVLLAAHRPAGSVLPVHETDDLAAARREVSDVGLVSEVLETPEGPVFVVRLPGGAELAVLEVVRPDALDAAYSDDD